MGTNIYGASEGITAHLVDTSDAHDAAAISITTIDGYSATNVQAMLEALADKVYYYHIQDTASTTWTIGHNLGYYPNVTVLDSLLRQVEGSIQHTDVNTVVVSFSVPFGGTALLT